MRRPSTSLRPGEPLALLLNAQSAQLAGDREAAGHTFRAMANRDDTKALGLRGLFIEAQRRGDHDSARAHAEEAVRTAPSLGWAGRAVLEARCQAGDWAGALALLEQNKAMLDKAIYRRQRAVLLTGLAMAAERQRSRQRQSACDRSRQSWRRIWFRRRHWPAGSMPRAATSARQGA